MNKHEYTLHCTVGNWNVHISPDSNYGYYEHTSGDSEGGLWFGGKTLVEFDGRYFLPRNVAKAIKSLGYKVAMNKFCIDGVK